MGSIAIATVSAIAVMVLTSDIIEDGGMIAINLTKVKDFIIF